MAWALFAASIGTLSATTKSVGRIGSRRSPLLAWVGSTNCELNARRAFPAHCWIEGKRRSRGECACGSSLAIGELNEEISLSGCDGCICVCSWLREGED